MIHIDPPGRFLGQCNTFVGETRRYQCIFVLRTVGCIDTFFVCLFLFSLLAVAGREEAGRYRGERGQPRPRTGMARDAARHPRDGCDTHDRAAYQGVYQVSRDVGHLSTPTAAVHSRVTVHRRNRLDMYKKKKKRKRISYKRTRTL